MSGIQHTLFDPISDVVTGSAARPQMVEAKRPPLVELYIDKWVPVNRFGFCETSNGDGTDGAVPHRKGTYKGEISVFPKGQEIADVGHEQLRAFSVASLGFHADRFGSRVVVAEGKECGRIEHSCVDDDSVRIALLGGVLDAIASISNDPHALQLKGLEIVITATSPSRFEDLLRSHQIPIKQTHYSPNADLMGESATHRDELPCDFVLDYQKLSDRIFGE